MGDIFREREIFRWCYKNDPEFKALAERLFGEDFTFFRIDENTGEIFPKEGDSDLADKLYEAYKIMAVHTEDDWDLFK
jgi:hypothetical protein